MKRFVLILAVLVSCSIGLSAQKSPDISGDWNGPDDLILQFTYNPTTNKANVDYCGIYRVMEWSPTARIENGYLILDQSNDSEGNSFSGKLRIESNNKMSGELTMRSYGETSFSGHATFTRSTVLLYSETPSNNPGAIEPYSGGQSADYDLAYQPLSDEPVVPTPQVSESLWKKNWKLVYGQDKFGDENRSDPRLVAASKFVMFIITPLNGIYLVFPDAKFAIVRYDNSSLSIKTKNMGIKEMPLNQISLTVFQLTNREDNYTMLDILEEGHFKLALELSEYGSEGKIFNAEVTDQTLGVINAMEYYFMDIPGFQDAWQFYGD